MPNNPISEINLLFTRIIIEHLSVDQQLVTQYISQGDHVKENDNSVQSKAYFD